MQITAIYAALAVFSGISAAAQSSPQPATTTRDAVTILCETQPADGKAPEVTKCKTTPVQAPVAQGCPVDMSVRQRMGGATMAVDANGTRRKVFAQKLRLFLNSLHPDPAGRKAVSAVVTVHGTGDKARMQALVTNSGPSALSKTFSVDLAASADPGVSGDLLLPGFTSASRVDLNSVTYDDGSTWRLSQNDACHVAVDPMMLIHE